MNKEDKLKQDYDHQIVRFYNAVNYHLVKNDELKIREDKEIFWNWINQNYISKEEVEGLKMEEKTNHGGAVIPMPKDMWNRTINWIKGWNEAAHEINQNIDNLFKDFKQVSNPLDPYDKP